MYYQFFHDLVNCVTPLSFYIDQNIDKKSGEIEKTVYDSNKQLKKFIISLRKHVIANEIDQKFNVHKEIRDICKLFSYSAKQFGVEFNIASKERAEIFGNILRFKQVISNIIYNAIEVFKEDGGGGQNDKKLISISISKLKNNKETIIKILNNGKMIPAQKAGYIFDKNFSTKGGAGVGLYAVRKIIENEFDGNVNLSENSPGRVCFEIKIPALRRSAKRG